jgi:hypothetical protein
MTATVTVTKSGDTIYFRPSGQPGSEQLAEYLNTLVNRTAVVHKATKELEAKVKADIEALEKQAEAWEAKVEKGAYGNLDPELRRYYAEKAKEAREQAAELRSSLSR